MEDDDCESGAKVLKVSRIMQLPDKKLAAIRSKNAAKYHLQTAITPFAD